MKSPIYLQTGADAFNVVTLSRRMSLSRITEAGKNRTAQLVIQGLEKIPVGFCGRKNNAESNRDLWSCAVNRQIFYF